MAATAMKPVLAALLLLGTLPGCLSGVQGMGAATTPAGTTDVGVSVQTLMYERGRKYSVIPTPELNFRRGVTERWDWGGRLSPLGLELGTRHRLLDEGRTTLSFSPNLGVWFVPFTNNTTEPVHLRLATAGLVDYRVSRSWTLSGGLSLAAGYAGPLTAFQGRFEGTDFLVAPGTQAGVALRLGSRWELRAQAGVEFPFGLATGERKPAVQGGLSVRYRRDRR